jgi:hypothetical protein
MKIKCKLCGEYFYPDEETVTLMIDGYLSSSDVNTCDECWDMLNSSFNNDTEGMISDADPGL